jgi:hypothetical protein
LEEGGEVLAIEGGGEVLAEEVEWGGFGSWKREEC